MKDFAAITAAVATVFIILTIFFAFLKDKGLLGLENTLEASYNQEIIEEKIEDIEFNYEKKFFFDKQNILIKTTKQTIATSSNSIKFSMSSREESYVEFEKRTYNQSDNVYYHNIVVFLNEVDSKKYSDEYAVAFNNTLLITEK